VTGGEDVRAAAAKVAARSNGANERRGWRPSPAAIGLAVATLAVAFFGVLNLARWASSATTDELTQASTGQEPPPAPASDTSNSASGVNAADAGDQVAQGEADPPADREVASNGGQGGAGAGETGTRGAETPATGERQIAGGTSGTRTPPRTIEDVAAATLPAASILVLTSGGPEVARGVAESTLISELLQAGFAPVDDETSASMQERLASARGIRDLGRQHTTGTVLFGDLTAQAGPGVGQFFTGTATLIVRAYDTNTGRLLD